ncbi:MAG: extensin family protein [Pseudolabrys sp.]
MLHLQNTAIRPDIAAMRLVVALLILAGVYGGNAVADETATAVAAIPQPVPLPRPRPPMRPAWIEPHSFREAAGPDFNSDAVTDKLSDCDERLAKIAVIAAMPRLVGPGSCGGGDIVRVDAVLLGDNKRIAIKPAPYLRCLMAEQLTVWVRDEAAPRVAATGATLRTVDTYDDFDCRGRNRVVGAKMSEHGKGNAVDVRSLTFADGRVVHLTDMTAPKDLRDDLRKFACARFSTVLGPGSDGYHESHIHLDLAERRNGYRICQWDVREPPKVEPPQQQMKPEPEQAEPAKEEGEAVTVVEFDGKPVPLPTPRPRHRAAPAQKL